MDKTTRWRPLAWLMIWAGVNGPMFYGPMSDASCDTLRKLTGYQTRDEVKASEDRCARFAVDLGIAAQCLISHNSATCVEDSP